MRKLLIMGIILAANLALSAQAKVSPKDISGLFTRLETADFFRFVKNKKEISTWKKLQRKYLVENGRLVFPSRSRIVEKRTGKVYPDWREPFDYYFLSIDTEELYKGQLKFYLEKASKLFAVRNLKLEIGEEKITWGEKDTRSNYQYFRHEVEINGVNVLFAEGNERLIGPGMYIKKFTSVLKMELAKQASKERLVMITDQDSLIYLIADDDIINIFKTLPEGVENSVVEE